MKKIKQFFGYRMIVTLMLLGGVSFVMESCTKAACGTKHHKKMKNKRIKKGTNFMTY